MESELWQAISAGGDVGTMALAALLWRLDRRVSWLEWRAGKKA